MHCIGQSVCFYRQWFYSTIDWTNVNLPNTQFIDYSHNCRQHFLYNIIFTPKVKMVNWLIRPNYKYFRRCQRMDSSQQKAEIVNESAYQQIGVKYQLLHIRPRTANLPSWPLGSCVSHQLCLSPRPWHPIVSIFQGYGY